MPKLILTGGKPQGKWGFTTYVTYDGKGKFIGYTQVPNGKTKAGGK